MRRHERDPSHSSNSPFGFGPRTTLLVAGLDSQSLVGEVARYGGTDAEPR
jgi:hypothetical protein